MQKITAKQIAIITSEKNFYFQKNLILEGDIKNLAERINSLENELATVKMATQYDYPAKECAINNLNSARIQFIYSIYKKLPKSLRYLSNLIFKHILKK
jgi:hypothetical protein